MKHRFQAFFFPLDCNPSAISLQDILQMRVAVRCPLEDIQPLRQGYMSDQEVNAA